MSQLWENMLVFSCNIKAGLVLLLSPCRWSREDGRQSRTVWPASPPLAGSISYTHPGFSKQDQRSEWWDVSLARLHLVVPLTDNLPSLQSVINIRDQTAALRASFLNQLETFRSGQVRSGQVSLSPCSPSRRPACPWRWSRCPGGGPRTQRTATECQVWRHPDSPPASSPSCSFYGNIFRLTGGNLRERPWSRHRTVYPPGWNTWNRQTYRPQWLSCHGWHSDRGNTWTVEKHEGQQSSLAQYLADTSHIQCDRSCLLCGLRSRSWHHLRPQFCNREHRWGRSPPGIT